MYLLINVNDYFSNIWKGNGAILMKIIQLTGEIFSFDEKEKTTMIDELCQPQRSTVLINYRHLSNFNDRLARVIQDEYYR